MSNLTPLEIASYIYCPILYKNKTSDVIVKSPTFFEKCLYASLIEGERQSMLRDTLVTPRRLAKEWDKIWWPLAAKRNISMTYSEKYTLKATIIFSEYCKYDISGYMYPTICVNLKREEFIYRHNIQTSIDLVKMNLTTKEKNTTIVNFTNRNLDIYQSAFDPIVRSNCYLSYMGNKEAVSHVYIYIDVRLEKIKTVMSTFLPKDIEGIRKMIYHVSQGIYANALYPNSYNCKGCKKCHTLQF